ncbi:MAG: recombinase RecA [Anaerovoracaceae bacterium]
MASNNNKKFNPINIHFENDEERNKALQSAMDQIQKTFGKGAVMKLGDDNAKLNIEAISTGSMSLDLATGIGGVPRGRIVEIYGPESSGKTTLTLHIIAEAQKNGGKAAFIDAEHALDPEYARNLGVDIDELLVSQPDYGEQALEIAEMLVRSGAVDVVVVDSVAALVPKNEIEGAMGDATVGAQARLMSQALRKLAGIINKTNTTIIFINQLREKIGVMFGNPETTTGGRALKFFSSMRMDVRRVESIKSGDDILGNRTKVKIVKNKVAPPFKQAEFDIMYGEGISRVGDVLDCAVEAKVINKAGSWYSFGDNRIGQGRENIKKYLEENPDVLSQVEEMLLETLKEKKDGNKEDIKPVKEQEPDMSMFDEDEIMIDEDGVIIE